MKEWKKILEQGFSDVTYIKDRLHIPEEEFGQLCQIQKAFPMFINPYYLSLINWQDADDPIRKMSVPAVAELAAGGRMDTSGEHDNTVIPGMQHKYAQTVLILSTNQCAMYCRHCFRKRLVGLSSDEIAEYIGEMGQYVREHKEISNILVSGGDAFLNSNEVIRKYLEEFCDIPHLDLIRFGTRTLVVLPQRITTDPELVELLREYGKKKQIYVVTQFNHPREVTPEAQQAVRMLMEAGVVVKNQTVLLKGVNDSPEVLGELMKRVTQAGIIPYYVFQCRPVTGVHSHFQVPLHEGYKIVEGAACMQNGQGKCFRYGMSHVTGKIEILGELENGEMLFKYHQAKYEKDVSRIFTKKIEPGQCWLD